MVKIGGKIERLILKNKVKQNIKLTLKKTTNNIQTYYIN